MKASHIREAIGSSQDELYELARDLVRVESVTGNEDDAQALLAERLESYGLQLDVWRVDESIRSHVAFCDDGNPVARRNLVARWGEPADRAALILNGHIDVVPAGARDLWDADPYAGRVHQGRLEGRGACDMKGGLAACCIAIHTAMKLGIEPKRPILLESVIGEETGGLGTLAAIERGYRADAAVIAEPTSLHLCPVQAGALSFRLHVRGRAAHGAMRASGVSAVEKFLPIFERLEAFERERHVGYRHPMYGEKSLVAPLSVGTLAAGNWPSTVPEELIAEGRFGIFPGEDCDDAKKAFEAAITKAGDGDDWLREHPVHVEWFEGQFEPGETPGDAEILESLSECHHELLGEIPVTHGVSYGSDLRLFTRYAEMDAVLYGPGDVALAHASNEYVPLDELVRAAEVYTLLIARALDA